MPLPQTYAQQKHLEEVAKRKVDHEKKRDPEFEQCVIEYVNWRTNGGQGEFEPFRRQWYMQRGMA